MMSWLFKLLFGYGLIFAGFVYGFAAAKYQLFPYLLINNATQTAVELKQHWRNDLGIEPTRKLGPARKPGDGVTILKPGQMQPGITMLGGFFDEQAGVRLIRADGSEIHRWVISYGEIWPDRQAFLRAGVPLTDWNVFLHGLIALEDGSIVFDFDTGIGLIKMDRCGNIVWKAPHAVHHAFSRAPDGTLWVPLGGDIAQYAPAGEQLRRINVVKMVKANNLEGIFYILPGMANRSHPNDVEVLTDELAPAFPQFEAGDLLYSMRDLNLLIVFDPDTEIIKWYHHGPWHRQHDPDFLPDGRISVFNNRLDFGASNIMAIDPKTNEVEVLYEGSEDEPFYTGIRGSHQHLENGNILIASTHAGRAFEVTEEGEIVWEYINRYDADRIAPIASATRFADDYFQVEDWAAPSSRPASLDGTPG